MNVVKYIRVSTEIQSEEGVSVEEQEASINNLIKRNGWNVLETFIDDKNYIKTKAPNKGKRVNPSGEYDDRPALIRMLELVKTGQVDAIICWRDDRLVRHPRVAVTLEDTLDEGDRIRKNSIKIYDANGSILDRFTLGIKAQVWREENKRRAERFKLGRIGTLKQGRWPGTYFRFGYDTIKNNGRGFEIALNEKEAETVKLIFDMAESKTLSQTQRYLIAHNLEQKNFNPKKTEWNIAIILKMLRCADYTGAATWRFRNNGKWTSSPELIPDEVYQAVQENGFCEWQLNGNDCISVKIPAIVSFEQFKRVQRKISERKSISTRNTKVVAALQFIACCGECGAKLIVGKTDYYIKTLADGSKQKYFYKLPRHKYRCQHSRTNKHVKTEYYGPTIDKKTWRFLVDNAIRHPEIVKGQVLTRQEELRSQGTDINSDIAQREKQVKELESGRDRLMGQLVKGNITQKDFERIMAQSNIEKQEAEEELQRLKTLRDDSQLILDELNMAYQVLANYERRLPELDISDEELEALPAEKQKYILAERKKIIQAMCEKVTIFPDGGIVINGLIDIPDEVCLTKDKYLVTQNNVMFLFEVIA